MTIAVLGLGAMGSRMAHRLADAGNDVVAWNRSQPRAEALAAVAGVRVAPTAADAAAGSDVVISMVRDDQASTDLWLGAEGVLEAVGDGAVIVEASTISPDAARELGAAAAARGVAMLEAPVVGSRPQAEAGALVSLVGGDAGTLDRVRDALETYSATVLPVGAVGTASLVKLAINGLFAIQVAAYAEIVGLLEATAPGVDPSSLLAGLPITSPGLQRILGLIADRDFSPNFPIELVAKDLSYLEALATDQRALPVATAAAQVFAAAAAGPEADLDIAGIAARYLR